MAGTSCSEHRRKVMSALEQNEGSLTRFAMQMLGDRETAADVVQHAFLQLCSQSAGEFPNDPKPWLFRVCRNRTLDIQRKLGKRGESTRPPDLMPDDMQNDPAAEAEQKDLSLWLHQLVDQLPATQREVILLWCQGFDYSQIAEITQQTNGAVRVNTHRGFIRLRDHPAVRKLISADDRTITRHTSTVTRQRDRLSEIPASAKGRMS